MTRLLLSAAAAALLFASPALAQTATATTATTSNSAAAMEQMAKVTTARDFASLAAMSDLFEIQTGEMAGSQAGSKAVKQFGKMLVKDHGKSSKQLAKLAKAAGIEGLLPAALDQRHAVIADSLKDARGESFDAAFAQIQVQAHQEGIALFKAYAANGDDAQLKAFAKKGLPVLEKHLSMAQKLPGAPVTQ